MSVIDSKKLTSKRPQASSPRDSLISALKGGLPLTEAEERVINAISAGYGLADSDPFWILILPPLLKGSDGEVKELLQQTLKRLDPSKALDEADRLADLNITVGKLTQTLDKRIERGVASALIEAEYAPVSSRPPVQPSSPVDVGQIRQVVTKAVDDGVDRLRAFRPGVAAAVLITVASVAFFAGIAIDKGAYEKHIAHLEARVAAFESMGKRGGER
ncbi:hypothetical protein [Azonexus sp.]|uniref:hypothetical protein n=1 Tax=Azonexus sp. TaxID=1872668 RepID=UPI0039E40514